MRRLFRFKVMTCVATLCVLVVSFLQVGCDSNTPRVQTEDPGKYSVRAKKTQEAKEKAKAAALKK